VELAEQFRMSRAERGLSVVFACASETLAARLVDREYASVEFGEELVFDPRRDPQAGRRGRELRKKVARAERSGVEVCEYLAGVDTPRIEPAMEQVVRRWLAGRRGLQTYVAPLLLFAESRGRRWFYARHGREIVGVLSLVRLDAHHGWLMEHLLAVPEAPQGTTETLVARVFAALGTEDCAWCSFGPSTLPRLAHMHGLGRCSELMARAIFGLAGRLCDFRSHARYRQKFQPVSSQRRFLLFHPRRFGLRELSGLSRAFNFSLSRESASPPAHDGILLPRTGDFPRPI
ncbi:MAG TPA: phosphatidylglycerol lysyltransferase domain-containing protein, partial [Polyangiaceae bacterium]|nr:phosphatidylglycerol lysyltransferase domain-containing protein [Polyangiaceae bacterium]